jgi:hypothetical protein
MLLRLKIEDGFGRDIYKFELENYDDFSSVCSEDINNRFIVIHALMSCIQDIKEEIAYKNSLECNHDQTDRSE